MYRVALVQNQSEMAHYSHADCRRFFDGMNYNTKLFTGDTIGELIDDLAKVKVDGVIFSSNCFNDKIIRSTLFDPGNADVLRRYAAAGHGLVIFHQLRLAQQKVQRLDFLPEEIAEISLHERPKTEPATTGDLSFGPAAQRNSCALYPNELVLSDIRRHCVNFQSLPGLYWHYAAASQLDQWDSILEDTTVSEQPRQLLLLTKDTARYRVAICALPVDWQHVPTLVQNICVYAIEGPHSVAIIKSRTVQSNAFEYFLESLRTTKFPHRLYATEAKESAELMRNIENNIHSEFVFSPYVSEKDLPVALVQAVEQKTSSGLAKKIHFDTQSGAIKSFSITGQERFARRILAHTEMRVAHELTAGYIDDSFWATVESLQCLYDIHFRQFDYELLGSTLLSKCDSHDHDGSYDEVFGASCALLWLRARLLGVDNPKTVKTAIWLRSKLSLYLAREQVLALATLIDCGLPEPGELEHLEQILRDTNIEPLSETDLIVFLQASMLLPNQHASIGYAKALAQKHREGKWTDLDTTATAVSLLLNVIGNAIGKHVIEQGLVELIRKSVFGGILYIRSSISIGEGGASAGYPWEGKASTTLKCLRAWTKFDEFLEFPANELIDTLTKLEVLARISKQGTQNILVLRSVIEHRNRLIAEKDTLGALANQERVERVELEVKLAAAKKELGQLQTEVLPKTRRARNLAFLALVFVSYLFVTAGFAVALETKSDIRAIGYKFFVDFATVHGGAFVLFVGLLRVDWVKLRDRIMARRSNESGASNS